MNARRILVTGATGFIGSAVARCLLARGHDVRVLLRSTSPRENLEDLQVEIAVGDLRDPESLSSALRGCDTVFHVAADYRFWAKDPNEIYETNVDGTRAIMRAALEEGVERIVYTSSVATLGATVDGSPADEDTPSTLESMIGAYKRSKFLAEKEVSRMAADRALPAIIVNPAAPVGPRDIKPTPTGKMIRDAAAGRMPAYIETGLNIVHVDDVAEGHCLAFERGVIGRRYILGGENRELRSILTDVAELAAVTPPLLRLPMAPLIPIAAIIEGAARVTGNAPWFTRDELCMARKRMYFSSDRARQELGYDPRPARAALADAVEWFKNRV